VARHYEFIPWEKSMPDRPSHQDLPEDWNHGSNTARGPFSAPGASDGYGAGTAGSHRARTADGYGTGPNAAYGAPSSDALGARSDSFGAGATDAHPARPSGTYGAGATEAFSPRPSGPHGAGAAEAFSPRPSGGHGAGAADTFFPGPSGGHGAGAADTFSPGPSGGHGAGAADTFSARPPGSHGAGAAGTYGAGTADPFGHADRFGAKNAEPFGNGDPFGPAPTAAFAAVTVEAGTGRPDAERPAAVIDDPPPREATDVRGFLGALFDFGFTSFVTPKVIKVLYMLIVIGTVVSALVFTFVAFKASLVFGFLTLVIGDPLFILIVLAIYRIILEIFVIGFRAAEDIRVLRERGDLR
jgi:Domain of unknown function (DUF4282)